MTAESPALDCALYCLRSLRSQTARSSSYCQHATFIGAIVLYLALARWSPV